MKEEFQRPDPDALLAKIQENEDRLGRGKLKIFLGYVAGVGKTYAMLEAAQQRLREGIDVVIGFVETHGRVETEIMTEGIPFIPKKNLIYRGIQLPEMDLDAILERKPQLVLVDELAHTNVTGSRHPKRYMDVLELLDAGINVYTAVNIQHFESLNDIVRQITGISIRETVPDSLMDEADEIELIDLPPDELIQRLHEGKVYVPQQASLATEKFFRKGNLTALREMTLRRAAGLIDVQMRDYMSRERISGPWAAGERILVCVSSHPLAARLVRTGKRLSDDLNAQWFVVFVETPQHGMMSVVQRDRLNATLRLAEQLGAKVVPLAGMSVPSTLLEFCHQNNVTKIVAGKPYLPRWREIVRGSVINDIIRHSGNIDVYVISEEGTSENFKRPPFVNIRSPWWKYAASILLVVMVSALGFPIHRLLEPTNLVMLFLAAVMISAVFLGRGPSILASVLSVVVFDFFFIEPRFSFAVTDTEYLLTFFGLLTVGLIISNSAALLRNQVETLRRHNVQISMLNNLSRELSGAFDLDIMLQSVIRNIEKTFSREVTILLPKGKDLVVAASTPGFKLGESEVAVAVWAYDHQQEAGRGTDTLPAATVRFYPLKTVHGIVGVIGVKPNEPAQFLGPEQRHFLDGFVNLAALAVERSQLADQARQTQILQTTEKLQGALLNSISHELRTPLVSITGILSTLAETPAQAWSEEPGRQARIELIETGIQEAHRLNLIVGNLLDMTRLEAGAFHLHLEPCDVQDLIGIVLSRFEGIPRQADIHTNVPAQLPLLHIDVPLFAQALVNLLDNALKYSPNGSQIDVDALLQKKEIWITVCDRGQGIPKPDQEKIFDKFYRLQNPAKTTGTGLGLAITRGIIEAHGGKVWAQAREGGGTTFMVSMPFRTSGSTREE